MTSSCPPREGILDIAPYKTGGQTLEGGGAVLKLSANEAALGPSPKAIAAAEQAAARLDLYPDPTAAPLREALGSFYGFDPVCLTTGPGSEYLLDLLIRCYAGQGDEVLFPALSFPLYPVMARAAGAEPVEAPAPDDTADVDLLLEHVSERTRVVIVANPNNPTGTWIPRRDLERLREGLPDRVMLIIDSAYAEYCLDASYADGSTLVDAHPDNTVMTRTFSKIHALAGARVGWAYAGEDVIGVLNRVRLPYALNGPAQAAAQAALLDTAHWQAERDHCLEWRKRFAVHLRGLGLNPAESAANFLFFRVPPAWGGVSALDAHLRKNRIIARPLANVDAMRITIGPAAAMEKVMTVITSYHKQVTSAGPPIA